MEQQNLTQQQREAIKESTYPWRLGMYVAAACVAAVAALWYVAPDDAHVLLAAVGGAGGGLVHVSGSFVKHRGQGQLDLNWSWWYIIHPARAAILAVAMISAMLSGVLAAGSDSAPGEALSLTIAFLTGLFSDSAVAKLGEIADTMFKPGDKP